METLKKLESRYFCHITYDTLRKVYHVYSMDNCHWDCAGSYRALIKVLAEDRNALRRIANR